MRLLVVNFEMNEASVVLAWQVRVVRELAALCEHVAVLTDRLEPHTAPDNVTVEQFARPAFPPLLARRLAALAQTWRVCRAHRVQAVFVHMAHRRAFLLYPVFRALNLPVLLWYAHGAVTWHLRLAHLCVDRVISSTPAGFRLPSHKVFFIGQGVDTNLFTLRSTSTPKEKRDLISVCRLSRVKRLDLLLAVMEHLRADGWRLKLVGAPLTDDDRIYETELRERVTRLDLPVDFLGFVPMESVPALYSSAALHLNVSRTISAMDKTLLEALACGCPVLTSNPAFETLLADYPQLMIHDDRPEAIAEQVRATLARRADLAPEKLRALVVGHHDLHSYSDRVMEHLKALAAR
jgi:glycosyltransferase involved in cell wall biosynthesis